jgi:4-aminobutyrate aminotransferase-like enzyme
LLGAGKSSLRLAPPLVIDAEDVSIALGMIRECLTELGAS